MQQLSMWVGSGLVTAGVLAAMLCGAGVASADSDSDDASTPAKSSEMSSEKPGRTPRAHESRPDKPARIEKGRERGTEAGREKDTEAGREKDTEASREKNTEASREKDTEASRDKDTEASRDKDTEKKANESESTESAPDDTVAAPKDEPRSPGVKKRRAAVQSADTAEPAKTEAPAKAEEPAETEPPPEASAPVQTIDAPDPTPAPSPALKPTSLRSESATPTASLIGLVTGVVGGVVSSVGSIAFTALQTAEAIVTGPPRVPQDSTVTVRSAPIVLGNGQRVDADWYFPETADGTPPKRMILLQHGFLALGPMYSYTAAELADRTGSVVVAPTLPSNPFLGDDHWLGGTGMAQEIADLFAGNRTALTDSAVRAGYGEQYDFGDGPVALPQEFALAGHSLGGNLVSAAAGFMVENGAVENLVGVILLDGVPFESTLPDAITKLDDYEEDTGRYIPIRHIGAPPNLFNSISNVNEVLSSRREGHFNGVVLVGGVHSDPMRGGNPLIQLALYLVAGFPQPQNPPAVEDLAVDWLDEWFSGDPEPVYAPGSTLSIDTSAGQARGVVIGGPAGNLLTSTMVAQHSPAAIPARRPALVA